MTRLSNDQVPSAVRFNRKRGYSKDIWKRVQERVGVDVDGVPGPGTAQQIAEFQAQSELPVDGKAGEQTLAAMGIELPKFDALKRLPGDSAFFYLGKMAIDADGAPNAYNPDNTGIDGLGNAGRPGKWWGLATDANGEPYVQGPDDPFPGYYVSTTALGDKRYKAHDPRRYVDATRIPYTVLPGNIKQLIDAPGLRKGDLAAVLLIDDPENIVFAIYADVGPRWHAGKVPGEGSIALALALGHDPYVKGRVKRGISSGVFYVVFPGSGERKPLSNDEIQSRGRQVFEQWGGQARLQQAMRAAGVS